MVALLAAQSGCQSLNMNYLFTRVIIKGIMFQLVDLIVVLRIQFWLFQTLIICPVDEMEFSRQCTCTPLRINENLVSCRYTLRAPGVHRIWSVHHVFMLQTLLYHLFRVHAKYTNYIIGHNKTHILVHQAYTAGCYVMCAKHNSIHYIGAHT